MDEEAKAREERRKRREEREKRRATLRESSDKPTPTEDLSQDPGYEERRKQREERLRKIKSGDPELANAKNTIQEELKSADTRSDSIPEKPSTPTYSIATLDRSRSKSISKRGGVINLDIDDQKESEPPSPRRQNADPTKSLHLYVSASGIVVDQDSSDPFNLIAFEHNSTAEAAIKTILRKILPKADAADFCLLHHLESDFEEITSDQTLLDARLKSLDLVFLVPKSVINIILPSGDMETLHVDFKTPIINVLSIVANLLGWDTIEDFLLFKGTEHELNLKHSLEEERISEGDTLFLLEDKAKATELKKKVRKKKFFFFKSKKLASADQEYLTPAVLLTELRSKPTVATIAQLFSCLVNSNTWYNEFLKSSGLTVLFDLLTMKEDKIEYKHRDENYFHFLDKLVHCVEIALDGELGINEFRKVPYATRKLVNQLDPILNNPASNLRKQMVLEMLTAICLTPEGHNLLLDAFDHYKSSRRDKSRFSVIVEPLNRDIDTESKVLHLALINTLINSPDDIELRINIRDEFIELGFYDILKKLGDSTEESIQQQIEIFEKDKKFDQEEVKLLAKAGFEGVDFNDINKVWKALKKHIDSPDTLLSILQRLLILSGNKISKDHNIKILKYIDQLVEKVVELDPTQTLKDLYISHEEMTALRRSYDEQIDIFNAKIKELQQGKDAKRIENLERLLSNRENELELMKFKLKELEEELAKKPTVVVQIKEVPAAPAPVTGDAEVSSAAAPPPPPAPSMGGPPPPPPPAPGMGGPPPPPPAPGGPPPPPGLPKAGLKNDSLPGLPSKPAINPKNKMKKLAWKKIPNNKVMSTIWGEAKDEIQIDVEALEHLFSAKAPAPAKEKEEVKEKKTYVSLLDPKRANHVGIALGRLKKPLSDIRAALISLNDKSLTLEELQSLKTFLPTPEELALVREYQGDKSALDRPEQFFLEIESVPNLQSRVECWILARTFEDRLYELLPQVHSVTKALQQTSSSKKFLKLLEIILAIGNYLNGGTPNGRAYGFKIDILLKLADTKSFDNKMTLLQYIIHYTEQKYPEVLEFMSELDAIGAASKVSSQVLNEELASIRRSIQKASDELDSLENQETVDSLNESYLFRLKLFVAQAKKKLSVLAEDMESLSKEIKKVASKFGEDPESFKCEEFFTILLSFNDAFEKVRNEKRPARSRHQVKPKSPRLKRTSTKNGGIHELLKDVTPAAIEKRSSIRRAKSIRQGQKRADSKYNLNNLLTMLDKMSKTE